MWKTPRKCFFAWWFSVKCQSRYTKTTKLNSSFLKQSRTTKGQKKGVEREEEEEEEDDDDDDYDDDDEEDDLEDVTDDEK